jgi:HEAT repeat protein
VVDGIRCDERAIPPLLRLMADPDLDVRFYAVAAFETDYPTLTTPAILAALRERLADPDAQIRQYARNALETRSS